MSRPDITPEQVFATASALRDHGQTIIGQAAIQEALQEVARLEARLRAAETTTA
ncbi:MAG: hypothetical protein ACYCXX_08715 [Acidiferrobacter thiooxydans]